MDLLSYEHDVPPLNPSMMMEDDWLDNLEFAKPRQFGSSDARPSGMPQTQMASPCVGTSAPMPISGQRAQFDEVAGDSWESTQSLLASEVMLEDSSAMLGSTTSLLHFDALSVMVPMEEVAPLSFHSIIAPPMQQQTFVQPAQGYHHHHTSMPAGHHYQQQQQFAGYQQQQQFAGCQQQQQHGAVVSWLQSSAPSQHMMAVEHTFYTQSRFQQAAGALTAGGHTSSHGSLTALDAGASGGRLPGTEEERELSEDTWTQDSDSVLMGGDSASLPHSSALRRSTSTKSRAPRPAPRRRALKPLRTQRSLSASKLSAATLAAGAAAAGECSPRPLRKAAKRSLVLTSAAAELVEERDGDSDHSVDIASADEGPSVCSEPGCGGKKKHNPWTLAETESLIEGVRIVGPGKWAEIKKLPIQSLTSMLLTRSAVDLKDKWRNLSRVARLPKSALKQRMSKPNSDMPLELILAVKDLMEAAAVGRD